MKAIAAVVLFPFILTDMFLKFQCCARTINMGSILYCKELKLKFFATPTIVPRESKPNCAPNKDDIGYFG